MLMVSAGVLGQEYLCSFQQYGAQDLRYGFEGERIFSANLQDIDELPCGEVDRQFVKMDSSTSLPHGQINATWGTDGSLTIPNGNVQISIYKVSRSDGQACTTVMEISSRGVILYSGTPLSNFNVSTQGSGTSSYVLDKIYFLDTSEAWQATINDIALISSYNGTSSFYCDIQ